MSLGAPLNERQLCASILVLGMLPDAAKDIGHFIASVSMRLVYTAECQVLARGEPLEIATLAAELERVGAINVVGGVAGLSELAGIGCPKTIEHYARVVIHKGHCRRIATLARIVQEEADQDDMIELESAVSSLIRWWEDHHPWIVP